MLGIRKRKTTKAVLPELPEMAVYPGSGGKPWNEVPLGVGESGEVTWDVRNTPTLTVIGSTGGGKDVLMRNAIIHCSEHLDDWEMWGVDIFRVNLRPYQNKYGLLKELALNIEDGAELCKSLVEELNGRLDRMEKAGVGNFRDLPDKPKAILLMIHESGVFLNRDEYKPKPGKYDAATAEVWNEELRLKEEARTALLEVSRMGRVAGIYLLMNMSHHGIHDIPDFQLGGYAVLTKWVDPSRLKRFISVGDFVAEPIAGRGLFQPCRGEGVRFQAYFADASKWLYEANDYTP